MGSAPVNGQRLALAVVALVGAGSVALPWARQGFVSAPLTVDTVSTGLVAGGFLVATGLTLAGDRAAALRSSTVAAAGVSFAGLGLVVFAVRAGILTVRAGVEPGLGVFVGGAAALVLAVGAWLRGGQQR